MQVAIEDEDLFTQIYGELYVASDSGMSLAFLVREVREPEKVTLNILVNEPSVAEASLVPALMDQSVYRSQRRKKF